MFPGNGVGWRRLALYLALVLPLAACLEERGDPSVGANLVDSPTGLGLSENPDPVTPTTEPIENPPASATGGEALRVPPPAREPAVVFEAPAVISQLGTGVATISWAPPSLNEDGSPLLDLAGFNIYYGAEVGIYTESVKIDNPGITRFVIDGLDPGTYYFVATAFNIAREESDYSNSVVRRVN